MERVTIRFYEELNDFLPEDRRKRDFEVEFELPRSVKDLIESLGAPHVEVDLILINGLSVGFDHLVSDGDRISVYPVFESLDIGAVTHLRPEPLREMRFILDVHLCTLARRLRMLGFDTVWENGAEDEELASRSIREKRILLTRDLGLLKRGAVTHGLFVRAIDPDLQTREVVERLDLQSKIAPFTRCIRCNGRILPIDDLDSVRDALESSVPPGVRAWCTEYHRCESCGRYYWEGSHYQRMIDMISRLLPGKDGNSLDAM